MASGDLGCIHTPEAPIGHRPQGSISSVREQMLLDPGVIEQGGIHQRCESRAVVRIDVAACTDKNTQRVLEPLLIRLSTIRRNQEADRSFRLCCILGAAIKPSERKSRNLNHRAGGKVLLFGWQDGVVEVPIRRHPESPRHPDRDNSGQERGYDETDTRAGGAHVMPNVRVKRATTAGRQGPVGDNVPRTANRALVACRRRSA